MPSPQADAAWNNAEWCAAVCRAHGIATCFDDRLWWSPTRTPPLYPDAVTLAPGVDAGEVLPRIDTSGDCSVKDSFADLDLAPAGFAPLFHAEWLRCDTPPEPVAGWSATTGDEESIRVLSCRRGGRVVAGAFANRSATVAGLTNVFHDADDLERAWRGAAAAVASIWPGLPLVGYASGAALEAARRAGFVTTGDLVVWAKGRPPAGQ